VILVVFYLRDLLFKSQYPLAWQALAVLAYLGGVTALLHSSVALSGRQLRVLEVVTVVVIIFEQLFFQLVEISAMLRVEELIEAAFRLNRSLMGYIFIILLYGMLIPNSWRRAASVVGPIALCPLLVRVILLVRFPELKELVNWETATFSLLIMAAAATASVYGSHVVSTLRAQAFEAKLLGQYQLVEKLGSGGMGEVWRAKHRMLARPAAIKLIRPEVLGMEDRSMADLALRRFEREAQATAALTSPHSVMIYDFGISDEGTFYYVMELLDGLDLDSLVVRFGPTPASRALRFLEQACSSLSDAHHQGLIHRDIKPANLFTCRMGQRFDFIKVLDFGLVKTEGPTDGEGQLTQVGVTTGTPAFMAPEQALGQAVDARTDVYALGCVGYWLLTGQLVFDSNNPTAMVLDHVKSSPTLPSQRIEGGVPEDLEAVIMACLEKDPDRRPGSAQELSDQLEGCGDWGAWTNDQAEHWWKMKLGVS
jgi:hypothetical protein